SDGTGVRPAEAAAGCRPRRGAGMRTVVAALFVALATTLGVRAEPPDTCTVPSYLLFGDSLLWRVTAAVNKKSLKIVVFGTMSSTLPGADGSKDAYPASIESRLRQLFPGVTINVVTYAKPRQPADKMAKGFDKVVADEKPNLVIWQTGTFDAIQGVDPREFLN